MSSDIFKAFHGFYKQIGKENRLHNRIEPFPTLFWALGILLAHILQQVTQPAGLEFRNLGTGTVLYTAGVSQVQFEGRSAAANPYPLLLYFLYGSIQCVCCTVYIYCTYTKKSRGPCNSFNYCLFIICTVLYTVAAERIARETMRVWYGVQLSYLIFY